MIGHAHAPPFSQRRLSSVSAIIPYISCQTQDSSRGVHPPVRAPSPFAPAREQVLISKFRGFPSSWMF